MAKKSQIQLAIDRLELQRQAKLQAIEALDQAIEALKAEAQITEFRRQHTRNSRRKVAP